MTDLQYIMCVTMRLLYTFCFVSIQIMDVASQFCEQGINCHLPDCFCKTFFHFIDRHTIPQIVYFGIDDGVRESATEHYDTLFGNHRKNPNGCPLSMTFFVSGDNTDYEVLKEYYDRGYELAVHSVTHGYIDTEKRLLREAGEQKANLVNKVGITKEQVIGWRSPYLQTAGDSQFDVLKKLGYTYDISLAYSREGMGHMNPFPMTLDFGWSFKCRIPPCPLQNHPGFWEVPVNAMRDFKDNSSCTYLDSCTENKPEHVDEIYKYIMNNFLSYYNGNRAPFGIHMHPTWFSEPSNVEAMDRAIDDMLDYEGVFIVNVRQMLEWMKDPQNLTDINSFQPWNCTRKPTFEITFMGFEVVALIIVAIGVYAYVMIKWFRKH